MMALTGSPSRPRLGEYQASHIMVKNSFNKVPVDDFFMNEHIEHIVQHLVKISGKLNLNQLTLLSV